MVSTAGCWITACPKPRPRASSRDSSDPASTSPSPASAGRLGARSRGTGQSRGGAHRRACSRQRRAPGSDRPARRTSRGVGARPTTRVAGLLASGVAHEFNNLLTVIYWRNQLIRDRVGTDPRLHRDAQDIERAAERAAALTEQLLAFGQQQSSISPPTRPQPAPRGSHVPDCRAPRFADRP